MENAARVAGPAAPIDKPDQKMTIPCFVINLKRSPDRRAAMVEKLSSLGIDHSFIDAVDGKMMTDAQRAAYAPTRRRLFIGHDLTDGEIGCLLSHRDVYRHMIAQNIPFALVLEDDTILSPDLPAVLKAAEPLMAGGKADMIRLLCRNKVYKRSRILAPLVGSYKLARPLGLPGGAYGYILSLKAARRINAKMEKNWVPVDTVHGQVWRTGLNVLSIIPSPVSYDEGGDSTIGNARYDKKAHGLCWWEAVLFPVTRLGWKLYEAFWKNAVRAISFLYDRGLARPIQ